MPDLAQFQFNTHAVRVINHDGQPWFVATDVCSALGYLNPSQTVRDHTDDDERAIVSIGRQGETNVVNESGLYSLILRSRKPEAKRFKKWVTSEVLPSIRKTGTYHASPKTTTEQLIELIKNTRWLLTVQHWNNRQPMLTPLGDEYELVNTSELRKHINTLVLSVAEIGKCTGLAAPTLPASKPVA